MPPYEKAMMTFFNTHGEGLLILPTHRVVANLAGSTSSAFRRKMAAAFEQEDYSFGSDAARAWPTSDFAATSRRAGETAAPSGMYAGGAFTSVPAAAGRRLER